MTLRLGLTVDAQGAPSDDLRRLMESDLRRVQLVRAAGWNSVWVGQHYATSEVRIPQPAPWLGRLTAETGEMDVGVGILLLSLLNPLDVAETYGTLDILSGGRLILGVGMGYREEEFLAFGIESKQRVARFTANLEVLKRLWKASEGSGVDAQLSWCGLSEASLAAPPVRRPRPPIWIGAMRAPAIKRAARLGDAWLIPPVLPAQEALALLDLYRCELLSAERDTRRSLPMSREIVCASSDREARLLAEQYLLPKYAAYASWNEPSSRQRRKRGFDDLAAGRFVVGSPSRCVDELVPLIDAGLNDLIFRARWPGMPEDKALASLELICSDVAPRLRQHYDARSQSRWVTQ